MKFIKLLRESFDDISEEMWVNAYTKKINEVRDNLLVKVSKNPDYAFILRPNMKKVSYGKPNKCETNVFQYVKEAIEDNKNNIFPVGGFLFENKSFYPVEHWWVYDKSADKHMEVTPLHEEGDIRCYAGVINFKINEEIKEAGNVFDLDFFKGGNVYHKYFK